jgi:preprotein translocase subunit SecA
LFAQRVERLLGDDGQITHDLDNVLSRLILDIHNERQWVDLLIYMTQGTRLAFDRRTHRKGQQRYNRLNYVFLTARLMQDAGTKEVTERVLEHLQDALERLQTARGLSEWNRLVHNEATLSQLDERRRTHLAEALGVERFEELSGQPVSAFSMEERDLVSQVLGKFWQNEVYRELLLHIISEQWVDYLTRVEALRVSIGLEAYAQRDPLVQYKSKATEMFTQLLAEIRIGVISRLFTYQSSRAAVAAFERERPEEEVEEKETTLPANSGDGSASANARARDVVRAGDEANRARKKKRRRH